MTAKLMTAEQQSHSPQQRTVLIALGALLGLGLMNFTGAGSGLARAAVAFASYESDMGRFPLRNSRYDATGGTTYAGTVQTEIVSMSLTGPLDPTATVLLPAPGTAAQVDSFFDVFTELRVGGGDFSVDSFFDITYRITNGGGSAGNTGTWDTEIVSMDLTAASPVGTIAMRLDPTRSSGGQHSITELADGTFMVDSFFDVFTELSIDGGPFVRAAGPVRFDLTAVVPEPASVVLALFGALGVAALARRRRCGTRSRS